MNLQKIAVFIFALLAGLVCIGTGALAIESNEQINANAVAVKAIEATIVGNKPVEVVALEQQADVAQAGFASNVAIAASGDLAQASMTKSFANAIWGIGFLIVALLAFRMYLDKNK